jgi:hypothetical protein
MLADAGGANPRGEEDFAGVGCAGFGPVASGVSAGLTVGITVLEIGPDGLPPLSFGLVSVFDS